MVGRVAVSSGRGLVGITALVFAGVLVVAPVAGATVTRTNITTNTIKAWDVADDTDGDDLPINDRTVSGSVDSGASVGDIVEVKCFNPISGVSVRAFGSTTVTAAKKWSITNYLGSVSGTYCQMVAVPQGVDSVSPADLRDRYRGSKVVSVGYWKRFSSGLGCSSDNLFNYDYEFDMSTKATAWWYMYSIGRCGLCSSQVRNPVDGTDGNYLWGLQSSTYSGVVSYLNPPVSGPDADPLLLVDGKLAMDPNVLYNRTRASRSAYRFGSKGGITVSYAINQRNGDVTIRESSPLYRCTDVTDLSSWRDCSKVDQTGVRFDRVVTVTNDHMIWRTADTFVSADGRRHAVRVTYDNRPKGLGNGYRLGTTGPYEGSVKGDKAGAALGPAPRNAYAVLGVIRDRSNTTVFQNNPVGDVVMSPRPDLIRFLGDDAREFFPRWSLRIPAKGRSLTVKQAYTIAASDSELVRLRKLAIAGLAK